MTTHNIGYGCNFTSHLQLATYVDVVPEQPQQSVHMQCGAHTTCQGHSSQHGQVAGKFTIGKLKNQPPSLSSSSAMLEFRDISYWLPAPPVSIREWVAGAVRQWPTDSRRLQDAKLKRRHGKQLLLCVNGCAHAGRLLAVMGPSGEPDSEEPGSSAGVGSKHYPLRIGKKWDTTYSRVQQQPLACICLMLLCGYAGAGKTTLLSILAGEEAGHCTTLVAQLRCVWCICQVCVYLHKQRRYDERLQAWLLSSGSA